MLCENHLNVEFLNLLLLNFLVESDAIADNDLFSTVRGTKRGSINDLRSPNKKRKTASGINFQTSLSLCSKYIILNSIVQLIITTNRRTGLQ